MLIQVTPPIIISNNLTFDDLHIGDLAIISDKNTNFTGEIVLRVYGKVVSLTNPENTWEIESPVTVELLPKGTRVILEQT